MNGSRPVQPGYTLIEVMVTLVLLVAIAATLLPALSTELLSSRVDRADTELKALTDALASFDGDVGEWPASLDQLVAPIGAADRDICGGTYNGGEQNDWAGPYLDRSLADAGLPVGIGAADRVVGRVPGPGIDYLLVRVAGVDTRDALELDEQVDGDGNPDGGTVRWTPTGDGRVVLTWTVAIDPC